MPPQKDFFLREIRGVETPLLPLLPPEESSPLRGCSTGDFCAKTSRGQIKAPGPRPNNDFPGKDLPIFCQGSPCLVNGTKKLLIPPLEAFLAKNFKHRAWPFKVRENSNGVHPLEVFARKRIVSRLPPFVAFKSFVLNGAPLVVLLPLFCQGEKCPGVKAPGKAPPKDLNSVRQQKGPFFGRLNFPGANLLSPVPRGLLPFKIVPPEGFQTNSFRIL